MVTSSIEAGEGRDVDTIYIPGVYLHMESYQYSIMVLKGRLSELLLNVDPKLYHRCVLI